MNIGISGLDATQIQDVRSGFQFWAGTSDISFVFDNSAPDPGVITIKADTTTPSDGMGIWSTQGSSVPNQINQGTILSNLGYAGISCANGPCLVYGENAPN